MDDDTGNLSEDDRKLKRTAGDRTEDPEDEPVTDGNRFCVYPLFLVVLFLEKDDFLIRAVFVPAISFVGVSIFRRVFKCKKTL